MANVVTDYFRNSFEELKKVSWPTREQTLKNTLIVIAMCVGFAILFALLDYLFQYILSLVI
ncbi:MAG: preprotein translocase subunit SecE [Patescibacteria group bacterium]